MRNSISMFHELKNLYGINRGKEKGSKWRLIQGRAPKAPQGLTRLRLVHFDWGLCLISAQGLVGAESSVSHQYVG